MHPDAVTVVSAVVAAFRRGDLAAAARHLAHDVTYVNLGFQPFELRGRDRYLAFLASVDRLYTAPRADELGDVVPITPGIAALTGRITVGGATIGGALLHFVRDGVVTDVVDVADDRARALEAFVDCAELARLTAVHPRPAGGNPVI